jgi:hypothetical protein
MRAAALAQPVLEERLILIAAREPSMPDFAAPSAAEEAKRS